MSLFAVERALWDLSQSPEHISRFHSEPEALLASYALTDEEKQMIKNKNVRALADLGSSQMLVMLYWLALSGGFAALPEYLGRMNTPTH